MAVCAAEGRTFRSGSDDGGAACHGSAANKRPAARCGERAPCRESDRTSSAVWLRLRRQRGRSSPKPDRRASSHESSRGCPCGRPTGLSHRHRESAPKRRPVPKRGDRSSRTGPGRGVACRAAGGPKRRVGDGRFGPRRRAREERKAGAAPGGPKGPRGVRKDTRKQWFASRFRGRGTGFPGAVLLAITVVIRSKMSISVLRA